VNQSVFVDIVEILQDGKNRGKACRVRSIVRLHALDEEFLRTTKVTNPMSLLQEFSTSFCDRKLEVREVWRGIQFSVLNSHCIHHVIERGTEIMRAITCDQRKLIEWADSVNIDDKAVIARLRLIVSRDGIRLSVEPLTEYCLESLEMCLCAPNF
jgi:hypothetical protein